MASSLFANTIEGLLFFVNKFKFKFNPRSLVVIFVLGISLLFLNEHLLQKFSAYSEATSSKELISNTFQTILFLFLSLLYTNDKRRTILIFIFILISASILGPSRVTMMAYMYFIFYSLKINKGFNLGVMTTSLYFSVKSIFFIINVFQFGHAYP